LHGTATIGCFWASDYQSGAIALHRGQFTEFSVSVEALYELQKHLILDQIDDAEIGDLREQGLNEDEIESTIEEWVDDYRVDAYSRPNWTPSPRQTGQLVHAKLVALKLAIYAG
jgi:hypothetical protein